MDDRRLETESGPARRVAGIIEPTLQSMGLRLVRVKFTGGTLQIMAEREDGTMTVEDCEEVSRALSPALDVEDPIEKAYHLEVSSPGIDRPLVRKSDFAAWTGHLAKVETSVMVGDRKRFRGRIAAVDGEGVTIEADQPSYGGERLATVPFAAIAEARLVLTDDLIRDALKKDKKARQDAKRRRGEHDQAEDGDAAAEDEND